ncbi:HEAT repeat domain-containing protein [Paenibacillus glucanolyticus]|uniref:HEAT repeat domain-containing protein n=1 Tax=Paenibacillus glucanolyticus TaxID=59843 RepID=UPI00128C23B2|nr:HEAT repeat domain-containing protein [Paenibacillus glucanolyticus]MPY16089.1 HEAT repeat domain-containing protein [Paenibacillus glucanolyticus]
MFSNLAMAYVFIYVCLGLIAAGIILLFQMKIKHNAEQKEMERLKKKYHDYFVYVQTHLHGDITPELPPGKLTPAERRVIQAKFMEWIEQFKGDAREKLLRLCRDAGFVEADIRALSSLRKDRRIEAAYRLGGMRAEEAVPQLQHMMNRMKYGPMTIIIARAIAKIAVQSQQIREMLSKLLSYDKAIHHMAADILLETRLDSASLMRKLLDDPDPGLVKVSLVAMWGQAIPAVVPALGKLVGSEEKDVRAEAVKLYLSSNPALKDDTIEELMNDHAWEVRSAAAKALGRLHAAGSIPLLASALKDDNWYVRNHSAESLAMLGEQGFETLCQAALTGTGPARETALYRIERIMAKEGEHEQVEQMVAYNKRKLVYDRYFGVQPSKRIGTVAGVGGDYTA